MVSTGDFKKEISFPSQALVMISLDLDIPSYSGICRIAESFDR